MPRYSTTKDTPIEFNKMSLQAGTRYRESGLVLGSVAAAGNQILRVCFGVFIADGGS
jgi:hypothetical protein